MDTAKAIIDALEKGDYEVEIEGPDCVEERTHRDGSAFYVVVDRFDIKSSNDAGSCTVYVSLPDEETCTFTCDLNTGEWSCEDDPDLAEDESVTESLESADGVISGEHCTTDGYIEVYEAAYGVTCDEYYWDGDDEKPMAADEIERLEGNGYTSVDYQGTQYYLLEEICEADGTFGSNRWARAATDTPDDWSKYQCVVLLFGDDDEAPIGKETCTDIYDSITGDFE